MDKSNDLSKVLGLVLGAVKSSFNNNVDISTQPLHLLSVPSLNFFSTGFLYSTPSCPSWEKNLSTSPSSHRFSEFVFFSTLQGYNCCVPEHFAPVHHNERWAATRHCSPSNKQEQSIWGCISTRAVIFRYRLRSLLMKMTYWRDS